MKNKFTQLSPKIFIVSIIIQIIILIIMISLLITINNGFFDLNLLKINLNQTNIVLGIIIGLLSFILIATIAFFIIRKFQSKRNDPISKFI